MNKIVICPICKQKETYGNMHWKNGSTMCRKCIEDVWRKEKIERDKIKQIINDLEVGE